MPAPQSRITPRKRPQQARSRATVDAILTATVQLLLTEGFEALTTNQVAERAGASVGTLYQYFPNKEALVGEIIDRELERFFGRLGEALELPAEPTVQAMVRAYVESSLAWHRAHRALFPALAEQLLRTGRSDLERILLARTEAQVARALERWGASLPMPDPTVTAFVVTRAVHGVVCDAALERPELLDTAALADHLVDLILAILEGR